MSTLSVISNFSLFPLLLLLIPINILRDQISELQSIMLRYITPITNHLKWVWSFLIHHLLFIHRLHGVAANIGEEPSSRQHKYRPGCQEAVECAVCLCKIEEGEDVRELRCDHLFHRDCLDRWVGYRHATCPICRVVIASHETIIQNGREVLVIKKFASFSTSSERDTWWLR